VEWLVGEGVTGIVVRVLFFDMEERRSKIAVGHRERPFERPKRRPEESEIPGKPEHEAVLVSNTMNGLGRKLGRLT
jgi:hypothetical protein